MKSFSLFVFLLCFSSLRSSGQNATVYLINGDSIVTKVLGTTKAKLIVEGDSYDSSRELPFSELREVTFIEIEQKYLKRYDKINTQVNVTFGSPSFHSSTNASITNSPELIKRVERIEQNLNAYRKQSRLGYSVELLSYFIGAIGVVATLPEVAIAGGVIYLGSRIIQADANRLLQSR